MPFEKERIGADNWLPVWVRNENLARFQFVTTLAPGKVVVDCASGDGLSSRLLAEAGAAGVHGFDLSPEAVEYARRVNAHANTQFEVASATELPLEDEAADLYVSLETIEHLDAVDELTRGGRASSAPRRPVRLLDTQSNRLQPRPRAGVEALEPVPRPRVFDRGVRRAARPLLGQVELLGQSFRSKRRTAALNSLGRVLPFNLAVRANQASKIPRFAYDKVEHHTVVELDGRREPEALVAVCSHPRKPPSRR